jgi:fructosamine-3-kinase
VTASAPTSTYGALTNTFNNNKKNYFKKTNLLVKSKLVYFIKHPANTAVTTTHKNSEGLKVLKEAKTKHINMKYPSQHANKTIKKIISILTINQLQQKPAHKNLRKMQICA